MMRARWVFNELEPEPPGVGQATVASWWPGKYWLVSTVQLDESSVKNFDSAERYPSVEFIQPIATTTNEEQIYRAKVSVPIGKAVPSPGKFVTQIYRCNKYRVRSFDGMMDWLYAFRSFGDPPLFEREYFNLREARWCHKATVDLLASGCFDPQNSEIGSDAQSRPNLELLHYYDYVFGEKGKPHVVRQALLTRVFEFPAHVSPLYVHYFEEWGDERSSERLKKMANSIALKCANEKQPSWMRCAVTKYKEDLAWLKKTYYDGHFDQEFTWPPI